jgi:hypothetical protein
VARTVLIVGVALLSLLGTGAAAASRGDDRQEAPGPVELELVVHDAVSRAPIAGAEIWLGDGVVGRTDARGRARLRLAAATTRLVVAAEGYAAARRELERPRRPRGTPLRILLLPSLRA